MSSHFARIILSIEFCKWLSLNLTEIDKILSSLPDWCTFPWRQVAFLAELFAGSVPKRLKWGYITRIAPSYLSCVFDQIPREADLDCAKEFIVMKAFVTIAVLLCLGKLVLFVVQGKLSTFVLFLIELKTDRFKWKVWKATSWQS